MKREYLTDNYPCNRSPGRSEEGNENTNENDKYLLTCNVVNRNSSADDSNDILAEAHPHTTNEEETTMSKPFDTPYTTLTALVMIEIIKGSRMPEFLKNVMP